MAIQTAPYQDPSLSIEARVADLLQRTTLEEKAGQLFHNMIATGPGGALAGRVPAMGILDTRALLEDKKMAHFNLVGPVADARLGIPVTLSTDPRHHVRPNDNVGTGFRAGALSRWPETFGLGALRDPDLVRAFADCVRVALHPQADLATEYRWARVGLTFGEDAELASKLVAAYIEGLQGSLRGGSAEDGHDSVSTMTKHFPGAGPEMDGEDSHFKYGREQVYPEGNFEYHLEPFRKAIEAGTRQIMVSVYPPVPLIILLLYSFSGRELG
jgi:beta-glucosidase